jgi:hypothetical protein
LKRTRDRPFDTLPLEVGEEIRWEAWEPTFHRFSYYAIVVTDRAVYLYSKLITSFTKWRRYQLADVIAAEFVPSWFMPKLVIRHSRGTAVLRTPPDTGEASEMDRRQLKEAADVIQASIGNA